VRVPDNFAEEYPDGEPILAEIYASLVRTGQVLLAELDRAADASFGVPLPVMDTLAVIEGAGELLTPGQIAERGHTSSATMTATLDTLERLGWAHRLPNPEDRRSALVEITDEGRSVADRFHPGVRALERALLGTLSDADRKALMRILAKVLAGAATVAAEPPITLEGRRHRPPA
jgi:DNA-binding MarR family transcriptional regulator